MFTALLTTHQCRMYCIYDPPFSPPPQEKFTPVKYFSIDRVFRNETLDATHLAEFHQIEGVVADYGLTLGDLMGILHAFFTKLGEWGAGGGGLGLDAGGARRHYSRLTAPCFSSRDHTAALQAGLQPVHGAQHGGVQLP